MLHRFLDEVLEVFDNGYESAINMEERLNDTDFEIVYNEYNNYIYHSKFRENKNQNNTTKKG